MTEPVSQTAEARKFLFWTDKRPVAPDVETRITCAIADAIAAIVGTPALLIFLYFIYNASSERQNIQNPILDTYGYPVVMLLIIVIQQFLIGNFLTKWGSGQNLVFQSGIPRERTRNSRWIAVLLCSVGAIGAVLMIYDLISGNTGNGLFGSFSVEFFMFVLIFGVSSGIATAHERLSWVLDLRAQQGHAIAFEAHPMAAPIVVENDWWKKPKSPSP
jgi:hypothetical protein